MHLLLKNVGVNNEDKFKQTIIKGVLKREFFEENIKSNIIPNVGYFVKISNIEGKVDCRNIDYNSNNIKVLLYPREID